MKPQLWEFLLHQIEEGQVVPIVGQDLLLLQVEDADGRREEPFYTYIAKRLARKLGVSAEDLPYHGALNAVVCRYLDEKGEIVHVYTLLKAVMAEEGDLPIPEPLRKLAKIDPLRLFVTTTFDPLLARALDEERSSGPPPRSIAFTPSDKGDLSEEDHPGQESRDSGGPIVFHLFGKIPTDPRESTYAHQYVITEEDTLEFVNALQSETRGPVNLIHELRSKHLLVLGSSFSEWLARFFLRIATGERLRGREKTALVADRKFGEDQALVFFLRYFGQSTKIFEGGGALEFVDELYRRWQERPPKPARSELPPAEMPRGGAIFLSYAREDLETARSIHDALRQVHLPVWFDEEALQGGERFRPEIQRQIEKSLLFVALISRHTVTRERGFFRREWQWAVDLSVEFKSKRRFIVPVLLDDTLSSSGEIPEEFRELTHLRLPGGRIDEAFVRRLNELFRDAQTGGALG